MKTKFEVVIDASREDVWAAFDNPDNVPRWQSRFDGYTLKAGERGEPGSIAELVFDERGRKVRLIETITEKRKPDFLAAVYESPHGSTIIVNHFESLDDGGTRWSSWCNFRFRGLMRFMSLFVAGVIRRRTQGDMERFKLMVETDLANHQSTDNGNIGTESAVRVKTARSASRN